MHSSKFDVCMACLSILIVWTWFPQDCESSPISNKNGFSQGALSSMSISQLQSLIRDAVNYLNKAKEEQERAEPKIRYEWLLVIHNINASRVELFLLSYPCHLIFTCIELIAQFLLTIRLANFFSSYLTFVCRLWTFCNSKLFLFSSVLQSTRHN